VAGEFVKDLLQRIKVGERNEINPYEEHRVIHLRPHVRTRTFWKNGQSFAGDVSYYEEEEDEEYKDDPIISTDNNQQRLNQQQMVFTSDE